MTSSAATRPAADPARRRRPKVAVWKFSSCDGCQLSVVDLEDELLAIGAALDLAYFREVTSVERDGPYDLSLVEGSVTTPDEAERIRKVRASSKVLITLGACATAGGIQALRNFKDVRELAAMVYASPEHLETLATSTAISDHVAVDLELRGCPVNKAQLLEVISAYLHGRRPTLSAHSVCLECKQRGEVCVLVTGTPCLGPITHAGCGALCPSFRRGCYGCFGPMEAANLPAMRAALHRAGASSAEISRGLRTFNANAPLLRTHSEAEARLSEAGSAPSPPAPSSPSPPAPSAPALPTKDSPS